LLLSPGFTLQPGAGALQSVSARQTAHLPSTVSQACLPGKRALVQNELSVHSTQRFCAGMQALVSVPEPRMRVQSVPERHCTQPAPALHSDLVWLAGSHATSLLHMHWPPPQRSAVVLLHAPVQPPQCWKSVCGSMHSLSSGQQVPLPASVPLPHCSKPSLAGVMLTLPLAHLLSSPSQSSGAPSRACMLGGGIVGQTLRLLSAQSLQYSMLALNSAGLSVF
jgi:hypothetical protein